jgi:hypothetical protein
MREEIMNTQKFWIIRFKGKQPFEDNYVVDTSTIANRHKWWHSDRIDDAYHFDTRNAVNKALRSPFWEREGYTRRSNYAIEIVEIREQISRKWIEVQVISNENALIQLAKIAKEENEHADDSED